MPPQAQAEMKRVMGQVQNNSFEYCVTPEEAKHPGGKMFTGKDNGDCRYDHFTMGGGKFDAAMRCAGPAQVAGNDHGHERHVLARRLHLARVDERRRAGAGAR